MATRRTLSKEQRERYEYEREKLSEWVGHEGTRIVAAKLREYARQAALRQMRTDPFVEPHMIVKAQQLRFVIYELLPEIIEGIVNFDADAIDMQVAPKDKWSVWNWFRAKIGRKGGNYGRRNG